MFWNVASARDEISLRKWSGVLRIYAPLKGALVALSQKMRFVGSNAPFSVMLLYT